MDYPGRVLKIGEIDADVMGALKYELNQELCLQGEARLEVADPDFDRATQQAVKLFQARNEDDYGRPLEQDGEVGSLTWAALFRSPLVARLEAGDALLQEVLKVAAEEALKEVKEVPRNSNRGKDVEKYLASTDTPPGNAWCCAFTYWCFEAAAQRLHRTNPMYRTAGCLKHWNNASSKGARRIRAVDARNDPGLLQPGMLFIMDHGGGLGHTGIIESIKGGLLTTIEGNTDASKTREGGGVYRLVRKVGEINTGFIDYTGL